MIIFTLAEKEKKRKKTKTKKPEEEKTEAEILLPEKAEEIEGIGRIRNS